jgi:copper chaperone NosL
MRRVLVAVTVLVAAGCSGGERGPAALAQGDTCAYCRMVISNQRFAAQIVADGEDARFYDDIGCMVKGRARDRLSSGTIYVADHRTGAWVRSSGAVFTRVDSLDTPMGSHVIAHADRASRDQDSAAAGGAVMTEHEMIRALSQDGGDGR